ncbi:MAG: site-specific tyrosine recombinase XerD [Planctomycetaceae bacterium]|nr:site-specific tyrosine recombinase XerD [Planctomycetaceae bacterium]
MGRRLKPPAGSQFAVDTFRDPESWLVSFLNYLDAECGMSRNTIDAYQRDLARFFEWNRRNARAGIHEITVTTMTSFLESLVDAVLAPSSIARNLVAVRMFFRFLMLEGVVAETTVDLVSSPKLWQRLPTVLSPETVDQLLVAPLGSVDRYYRRDRAILAVMYATGCRVSEVVDLKLSDVNLTDGVCRCTGKGNKQRMVSLNPLSIAAVEQYLRTERESLAENAGGVAEFLFLTRSGRRMNRETVWELIRRYAIRIGCSGDVSPHTLRHSFATHMLAGGADIRALQEMLGHANIRTTQVYTHVDHSRLKSVHRKCHPRG